MKGAVIIIRKIKIIFTIRAIGITEAKSCLLFLVSSAINFDKAIGRPNCEIPINNEKVGRINMYRPRPVGPIFLEITIFISMPRSLVMRPPIVKMIVDLINFSFIILFMKKIKKIYLLEKIYDIINLLKSCRLLM